MALALENLKKLLKHDEAIYNSSPALIVGVDEVGRGCLAGPVCTGGYSCSSFYIDPDELIEELTRSSDEVEELSALLNLEDSKKVIKTRREALCKALLDVPGANGHIFHSTKFQSAKKIDKTGIVKNIWISMVKNLVDILEQYLELYNKSPEEVILLVDGPKTIPEQLIKKELGSIQITQIPIIRGDSKSSLIAAASNLAKQERDLHMEKLGEKNRYKNYIWTSNVGYGTRQHIDAILEHGITNEHRKSYLGNYIEN